LEVYYDITGSTSSTGLCDEAVVSNNGGANYKASFTIQSPLLASANPTTCNGSEGFITISGLNPGSTYGISYSDDGTAVGPNNVIADGSGQIQIAGLNAGIYSDFELAINGCITNLNTGLILSNPVIIAKFNKIAAFCEGTAAPALPTTSLNGLTGTWSPSVISNTTSGSYTFTPNPNQCGIPVMINVTVTPKATPIFAFGTSLTICSGGNVPVLPSTSTNGIAGTWTPSIVSSTASAIYTFTPSNGQCANSTSFSVTVNPNIAPTFGFGSSLTICAGSPVPTLPTTSDNGITGTWSSSTIDNQNSAIYTFTPSSGQCATTTTFDVTVNPIVTAVFSFGPSLSICAGGSVPLLSTTSDNGISGTWSPATIDNQSSNTYTFTPGAGICAPSVTLSVLVAASITPTFSFGNSLGICAGENVPSLATTSDNGIAGTWTPSTIDNQNSGIYTFTPSSGQCATTVDLTVTVNPNITPAFDFGSTLTICAGDGVPSLPNSSNNNISGTWNPASIDNQNAGTYTFTPSTGQCALTTTFTVTVNSIITPVFSFGSSLSTCAGGSAPALSTTSDNGITGIWTPSTVDNQTTATYTFTPTPGQCANTISFPVNITPTFSATFNFGTLLNICNGGTVPTLPSTSTNGITGTWSPANVDNQNSATYTFTPDAGQCATPTGLDVTINPVLISTFSFGTAMTICAGANVSALPVTSLNGITGTWTSSVIDNQNSNTYIFTPGAGQCGTSTSLQVTVNPTILPAFSFGPSLTVCPGTAVPTLPSISDNGISGTWSPSTIDNQNSGIYTFTPTSGQCVSTVSIIVTVSPMIVTEFSFGTNSSICAGSGVPTLPNTSVNGITGTWNPATVDNQNSNTYSFTPGPGQCAVGSSFTVTVDTNVVPIFDFGTSLIICAGSPLPSLPQTSQNGVFGVWNPATVNDQASGVYTFTPAAGQCGTSISLTVTVNQNTIPTFSFGTSLVICAGATVPALPAASANGIAGTWNPAIVSNQASGVYTFTPDPIPGQCLASINYIVTVNQNTTPTFSFGTTLNLCAGTTPPALPATSTNAVTGTWSSSVINNQTSGTYTFTPNAGQCASPNVVLTVNVTPVGTVDFESDTSVTDGTIINGNSFYGTPSGVSFTWTNSNTSIGLAASGTGNVPTFTAINKGSSLNKGTIVVTPVNNGCAGAAKSYVITVIPLSKDIFVPNVFSPNGDGKNDILYAYSNYIDKMEMQIFNQWGQLVQVITDKRKGWDGKYKGAPQPVGVYMYVVKATMTDGRTINLKGSTTLLR